MIGPQVQLPARRHHQIARAEPIGMIRDPFHRRGTAPGRYRAQPDLLALNAVPGRVRDPHRAADDRDPGRRVIARRHLGHRTRRRIDLQQLPRPIHRPVIRRPVPRRHIQTAICIHNVVRPQIAALRRTGRHERAARHRNRPHRRTPPERPRHLPDRRIAPIGDEHITASVHRDRLRLTRERGRRRRTVGVPWRGATRDQLRRRTRRDRRPRRRRHARRNQRQGPQRGQRPHQRDHHQNRTATKPTASHPLSPGRNSTVRFPDDRSAACRRRITSARLRSQLPTQRGCVSPVGGHEILPGGGQVAARAWPTELPTGGQWSALVDVRYRPGPPGGCPS